MIALPLFEKEELGRLQERREALLRRVQAMPKHSPGRYETIGQLKAVTAELMRLELKLRGELR